MIETKTLKQIQAIIANGETCVVNLTADWCSDCTDQAENLARFGENLATKQISSYTLVVQEQKNTYLSEEHQTFTEQLGGHGFPRTVLVVNGQVVDADNVEVISEQQLTALTQQFFAQLA
jgi:thiol:disulfide interchange protein